MKEIDISEIEGFRIGNAQDVKAATGCTAVICEKGASSGVDVRGGSPATRETDLLNPVNMIQKIHAVMLSGGSSFGLDASSGAMQYLEENGVGFDVKVTKVPIVCAASLFDLTIGDYKVRPDKKMGYEACKNSEKKGKVSNGNVGAGCGATVGKILGEKYCMKGGLGTFAVQVGKLKVGAIVAVNCLGDIINSEKGKIIAGCLNDTMDGFRNTEKVMLDRYDDKKNLFNGNTTIGVVITNGYITKDEANKIASMAHNGYARAIRPAHSMFDGDTIFVMGGGDVKCDASTVGFLSAEVIEKAIIRGIISADSIFGIPCYKEKMGR